MWTSHALLPGYNWSPIRHWCEQGDGLAIYGWRIHDGNNFGVQQIVDQQILLATSFIKRPGGLYGGDWTAKIVGEARVKYLLFMYILALALYDMLL